MSTVLIVDDEEHIREDLKKHLKKRKYQVYTASTVEDANKIILSEELDYALIDLTLDFTSEYGGIKVFTFVKEKQPKVKPFILSAYPFIDVKEELKKELKEEEESERILQEIEEDYISKGGKKNYIEAVLEKLEELGQKEQERG